MTSLNSDLYYFLKNNLQIIDDKIINKIIDNLIINDIDINNLKVLLDNFNLKDLTNISNINNTYLAILKSHHIKYQKKLYDIEKLNIVKKINNLNNDLDKLFYSYNIIPTIEQINKYNSIVLNIGDEITKSRKSLKINDYDQLDTLYEELLSKRKIFNKSRLDILNKESNEKVCNNLYNSMQELNREILENFIPDTNSFSKKEIQLYRKNLYDLVKQFNRLKKYITGEDCEKLNFQFARCLDNDKLIFLKEQEYIRKNNYQSNSYM